MTHFSVFDELFEATSERRPTNADLVERSTKKNDDERRSLERSVESHARPLLYLCVLRVAGLVHDSLGDGDGSPFSASPSLSTRPPSRSRPLQRVPCACRASGGVWPAGTFSQRHVMPSALTLMPAAPNQLPPAADAARAPQLRALQLTGALCGVLGALVLAHPAHAQAAAAALPDVIVPDENLLSDFNVRGWASL